MDLKINGENYSVELEDKDIPLLWVLRDILDLTGTKYSCGIGQCGACSVLVNEQPVRSCITPASSLEGKQITTIEGAENNKVLRVLQKNWVSIDVPQCGYCQSGQLMSATALLSRSPNPFDQEITEAMRGNLCRCGTYNRVLAAIKKTAEDISS